MERFWSKVDKTDGCWLWIANKTPAGYGKVKIAGKTKLAHRVSYELTYGKRIPKNRIILHQCDNPSCVKPEHLSIGTQKQNIRDMITKHRDQMVGDKNNKAILTTEQVKEIRHTHGTNRQVFLKDIAKEYGVSLHTIHRILKNQAWKHV